MISRNLCTRRNPISISAAAIYMSCLLEDKSRTQAEICKATGLSEVTLRKVFRELSKNLDDLLPPYYQPKVPPEKAFSMTAPVGRTATPRQTAGQGETETEHGTGSEGSVPSATRWSGFIPKTVERNETDGQVGEAPSSVGVSKVGIGAAEQKVGKKGGNGGTGEGMAIMERQMMREDAQYDDFEERVGNGTERGGQMGVLSSSSQQQPTPVPIGPPSGLSSFQPPGLPFANLREMPLVWGGAHLGFAGRPLEGSVRGGEGGESVPSSLPMTPSQAVPESMSLSGLAIGGPSHFNMAANQREFGPSSVDYKREGSHDRERSERRETREERQREERGGRTRQEGTLDNTGQGNANLSSMRVHMPSSAAMNLGAFAAFPPNLWPIFAAGGGPSPSAWGAMLPPQLMPMGGGIPPISPIPQIPPIPSDTRNSVNTGSGTGGLTTRGPGTPPGASISGGLPPGLAEAIARSTMLASHSGLPPMWPPFHMMFPPTPGSGGPDGSVQMPFGSFQDQAMAIRGAMVNGQGGAGGVGGGGGGGPMFPLLNMGLSYPQALMEKQHQVAGALAPPPSAPPPSHDRAQ